jgi:Autoinducer synthase
MIVVVNTENRRLCDADLTEMYRQRKIVFVDRAGRKFPAVADHEIKCYDLEDTIYLLAKEELEGPLLASVRLLPTTRPHLIGDLFPATCRDAPPRGPTVWGSVTILDYPGPTKLWQTPAIRLYASASHQRPDQFEPDVDEQRTSSLCLGQAAPIHQVKQSAPSTGDLAHG